MSRRLLLVLVSCLTLGGDPASAEVVRRTANDGNVLLEGVPEVPPRIVERLNRYLSVRSASFRAWTENGSGIYITTRFGRVNQLHRVDAPGGALPAEDQAGLTQGDEVVVGQLDLAPRECIEQSREPIVSTPPSVLITGASSGMGWDLALLLAGALVSYAGYRWWESALPDSTRGLFLGERPVLATLSDTRTLLLWSLTLVLGLGVEGLVAVADPPLVLGQVALEQPAQQRLRPEIVEGARRDAREMAQRGGTVLSHLKVGDYASPLIRPAQADGLLVLKAENLAQHGAFLKDGGWVVANGEHDIKTDYKMPLDAVDADTLAQEIGNPKAVNLIVLGFALAMAEKKGKNRNTLFCSPEEITIVLESRFGKKEKMLKASLKALDAGYRAIE